MFISNSNTFPDFHSFNTSHSDTFKLNYLKRPMVLIFPGNCKVNQKQFPLLSYAFCNIPVFLSTTTQDNKATLFLSQQKV